MRTLLTSLEGKTIEKMEFSGEYNRSVDIFTTDGGVMRLESNGNFDRCGEYEGTSIDICMYPSFSDKMSMGILSEEDMVAEMKRREEIRLKRELEEKKKSEEAAEKMKRSELELLAKLKNKYEGS